MLVLVLLFTWSGEFFRLVAREDEGRGCGYRATAMLSSSSRSQSPTWSNLASVTAVLYSETCRTLAYPWGTDQSAWHPQRQCSYKYVNLKKVLGDVVRFSHCRFPPQPRGALTPSPSSPLCCVPSLNRLFFTFD